MMLTSVIYCSCFTVNSHYKVVFNCATVRNVFVYYCNCFEVTIIVIDDPICLGSLTLHIHIQISDLVMSEV